MPIRGATIITIGDQIRSFLTARLGYWLAFMAVIIAVIDGSGMKPSDMNPAGLFAVALTFLLFMLGYIVLISVFVGFYCFRLKKDQRQLSYEIDVEAIRLSDATGMAIQIPWTVVRRVRETGRAFRFDLKTRGNRYIPKRAFTSGDVEAIRALAAGKIKP